MQHQKYTQSLSTLITTYSLAKQGVENERTVLMDADNNLSSAEDAQRIIQESSLAIQNIVYASINTVVSKCMETVFDQPYRFKIEFERKRGKTEAVLKFIRDGIELDDPINQAGGGVIDVAAFALRLAALILQRPPLRRILVCDEPWRCLRGRTYRSRMRALVESLSKELGVSFILCVDHEAYGEFVLGNVVEIR